MVKKIKWNKNASKEFEHIQAHILKHWGEFALQKFTSKAFHFLDLLSIYPFLGSLELPEKAFEDFASHHKPKSCTK